MQMSYSGQNNRLKYFSLQALEQEPNEERHQVLSMLSAAFGAMGEECFQRKPAAQFPRNSSGARRFGSAFSFSTGNLDTLVPKTPGMRRMSESSACITESIEEEALTNHLEKYSDMLVELVKEKLLKWQLLLAFPGKLLGSFLAAKNAVVSQTSWTETG